MGPLTPKSFGAPSLLGEFMRLQMEDNMKTRLGRTVDSVALQVWWKERWEGEAAAMAVGASRAWARAGEGAPAAARCVPGKLLCHLLVMFLTRSTFPLSIFIFLVQANTSNVVVHLQNRSLSKVLRNSNIFTCAREQTGTYHKPREDIAIPCQFSVSCICLLYPVVSPKWLLP